MLKVAFLNGEPGYGSLIEEQLAQKLTLQGIETTLVDDLFHLPAKLRRVLGHDTIIVGTTGQRPKDIRRLFENFQKLDGYRPESVVFTMNEESFIGYARLYPMIKFYRLDYIDLSFIPLTYFNGEETV